jgi:hypothetical protein
MITVRVVNAHGRIRPPEKIMKRIFILILAAMLFFSLTLGLSAGLSEGSKRFALEIDPLPLVFTVVHASFHIALSNVVSIPIYYSGFFGSIMEDFRLHIFSLGLRFYPAEKVHSGFYIFSLVTCVLARENYYYHIGNWEKAFGYGLELGYVFDIGKSAFFDIGFGLVRYIYPKQDFYDELAILPAFNCGFGVKF